MDNMSVMFRFFEEDPIATKFVMKKYEKLPRETIERYKDEKVLCSDTSVVIHHARKCIKNRLDDYDERALSCLPPWLYDYIKKFNRDEFREVGQDYVKIIDLIYHSLPPYDIVIKFHGLVNHKRQDKAYYSCSPDELMDGVYAYMILCSSKKKLARKFVDHTPLIKKKEVFLRAFQFVVIPAKFLSLSLLEDPQIFFKFDRLDDIQWLGSGVIENQDFNLFHRIKDEKPGGVIEEMNKEKMKNFVEKLNVKPEYEIVQETYIEHVTEDKVQETDKDRMMNILNSINLRLETILEHKTGNKSNVEEILNSINLRLGLMMEHRDESSSQESSADEILNSINLRLDSFVNMGEKIDKTSGLMNEIEVILKEAKKESPNNVETTDFSCQTSTELKSSKNQTEYETKVSSSQTNSISTSSQCIQTFIVPDGDLEIEKRLSMKMSFIEETEILYRSFIIFSERVDLDNLRQAKRLINLTENVKNYKCPREYEEHLTRNILPYFGPDSDELIEKLISIVSDIYGKIGDDPERKQIYSYVNVNIDEIFRVLFTKDMNNIVKFMEDVEKLKDNIPRFSVLSRVKLETSYEDFVKNKRTILQSEDGMDEGSRAIESFEQLTMGEKLELYSLITKPPSSAPDKFFNNPHQQVCAHVLGHRTRGPELSDKLCGNPFVVLTLSRLEDYRYISEELKEDEEFKRCFCQFFVTERRTLEEAMELAGKPQIQRLSFVRRS